jgi:hypothetical protein
MKLRIAWNKGIFGQFKHSEETKRRIGIATAKREVSQETRMKLSNSLRNAIKNNPSIRKSGSLHPFWRGGIKPCEMCGTKEKKYKSRLCCKCHRKNRFGKDAPAYRGVYNKCISCGAKLQNKTAKRCSSCYFKYNRGENNKSWKGGITKLCEKIRRTKEYFQWRDSIYKRDGFECLICASIGGKLNAHHRIKFSQILIKNNISTIEQAMNCDDLWDIKNGVTVCSDCHTKIHRRKIK